MVEKIVRSEVVRVRAMAYRRGIRLVASRTRDPEAADYGCWAMYDARTGALLHAAGPISPNALTWDQVKEALRVGVEGMLSAS